MARLLLLCFIYSLPGPPKITLDTGTYQLYPVNKRLCSDFDAIRDTSFHLYTRDNINHSQILKTGNDSLLRASKINFANPTVIFFHGFLESYHSADAMKMKEYYLRKGDYNVILVNNERLVGGPFYINSVLNVKPIGYYTADFVEYLVGKGLSLSNLHVIGMSLGAHMAGMVGKGLKSGKIARVTGLDPAGPPFTFSSPKNRLSKGDAEFVDVVHTNAGLFGITSVLGDADIWFNGGHFQPGCDPISTIKRKPGSVAELVFCNHYQGWRVYVETLINPKAYLAVKCKDYSDFKSGKCNGNEKIYAGVNIDNKARGNYYVSTGVTAVDV